MDEIEIKEIKDNLICITTLTSTTDPYVIDCIKKGLEVIVKLEIEKMNLKTIAEFYKTKSNDLNTKLKKMEK